MIVSKKLRASNLIVLVESKIKHEIFNKKIDFLTIFKKEISRKMIVSLLAIYRGIDIASKVANQIIAFALVYYRVYQKNVPNTKSLLNWIFAKLGIPTATNG